MLGKCLCNPALCSFLNARPTLSGQLWWYRLGMPKRLAFPTGRMQHLACLMESRSSSQSLKLTLLANEDQTPHQVGSKDQPVGVKRPTWRNCCRPHRLPDSDLHGKTGIKAAAFLGFRQRLVAVALQPPQVPRIQRLSTVRNPMCS